MNIKKLWGKMGSKKQNDFFTLENGDKGILHWDFNKFLLFYRRVGLRIIFEQIKQL